MVKSSIFKLCTIKYLKYITKYIYIHNLRYVEVLLCIHNLGYVEVLSENAINKVS